MTAETIHTCSYSCERPECIRAQRDELVSRLAAAPPPAAARGDVRGLVSKWRERAEKLERGFGPGDAMLAAGRRACADELEAALAAEGVQAGEVEERARELLAQHEQQDKTGGAPVVRRDDALRAIASALWQQPEARGVVDESLRRDADRWRKLMANTKSDHIWHFVLSEEQKAGHDHFLDVIDALPLTGERNG